MPPLQEVYDTGFRLELFLESQCDCPALCMGSEQSTMWFEADHLFDVLLTSLHVTSNSDLTFFTINAVIAIHFRFNHDAF